MRTQSFFVVSSKDHHHQTNADGVIVSKDKKVLGDVYNEVSPDGRKYIVCKLKDYWIVTDEEYKQLRKKHDK